MVDLVKAKDAMGLAERELEVREVQMKVPPARVGPGELEWAVGNGQWELYCTPDSWTRR